MKIKFVKNERGNTTPIIMGVITLGIVGIVFSTMVMVYSNIEQTITSTTPMQDFSDNPLMQLLPIVLAATLILTIILGFSGVAFTGHSITTETAKPIKDRTQDKIALPEQPIPKAETIKESPKTNQPQIFDDINKKKTPDFPFGD